MTHHEDAAYGRDIMLRWRALAEKRLRYLAELYESGRWRRLYSEREFLENVREAKRAVEVWRDLSTVEGARSAAWMERPVAAAAPLSNSVPPQQTVQPKSVQIAASVPVTIADKLSKPPQAELGPQAELVPQDEKHPKATPPVGDVTLDSIKERYPLLRTTF
jgi:uncharacterized repeat protein (TIGR03809 family)